MGCVNGTRQGQGATWDRTGEATRVNCRRWCPSSGVRSMKNLYLSVLCALTLLPLSSCTQQPAVELCYEQEEADTPPEAPSPREEAARFRGGWAVIKGEIEGER